MPEVIDRFTASQVIALTGITYPVLDYWVRTKFIVPAQLKGKGKGSDRFFSFRDVVAIKAALRLRKMGASVQTLRKTVKHIQMQEALKPASAVLAGKYLFSDGREIYEKRGKDIIAMLRHPDQLAFAWLIDVNALAKEVEQDLPISPKKLIQKAPLPAIRISRKRRVS